MIKIAFTSCMGNERFYAIQQSTYSKQEAINLCLNEFQGSLASFPTINEFDEVQQILLPTEDEQLNEQILQKNYFLDAFSNDFEIDKNDFYIDPLEDEIGVFKVEAGINLSNAHDEILKPQLVTAKNRKSSFENMKFVESLDAFKAGNSIDSLHKQPFSDVFKGVICRSACAAHEIDIELESSFYKIVYESGADSFVTSDQASSKCSQFEDTSGQHLPLSFGSITDETDLQQILDILSNDIRIIYEIETMGQFSIAFRNTSKNSQNCVKLVFHKDKDRIISRVEDISCSIARSQGVFCQKKRQTSEVEGGDGVKEIAYVSGIFAIIYCCLFFCFVCIGWQIQNAIDDVTDQMYIQRYPIVTEV